MKLKSFCLFMFFLLVYLSPLMAQSDAPSIAINLLKYEPYPAQPGKYVHLWINVENKGTDKAENLIVVLEPEYPFSLDSNENATREINTLEGKDNAIVDYKVRVAPDAVEGENEIRIKYSMGDRDVWVEKKIKINVHTPDVILDVVSVESNEVEPGNIANLKIKIKNEADSYLRNVKIKLELRETFPGSSMGETKVVDYPFSPINSTAEKKIYLIKSGEEKTVDFSLLANPNAECGPYKIPITLSYYDNLGNKIIESDFITLLIAARPELAVELKKSNLLTAGQTGNVVLDVINKGLTKIKYLTLSLEPEGYEILSPKTIYIGNLDPDDYDTTEFKIYVKPKEKNVSLKIKLEYRDGANKKYSEEKIVNLKLHTEEELQKYNLVPPKSNIPIIVLGIFALIIIYLSYKKLKK